MTILTSSVDKHILHMFGMTFKPSMAMFYAEASQPLEFRPAGGFPRACGVIPGVEGEARVAFRTVGRDGRETIFWACEDTCKAKGLQICNMVDQGSIRRQKKTCDSGRFSHVPSACKFKNARKC